MSNLDDALQHFKNATITVDDWCQRVDANKPYNYQITEIYQGMKSLELAAHEPVPVSVSPSSSRSASPSPSASASKSASPSPSTSRSASPSASASPSSAPSGLTVTDNIADNQVIDAPITWEAFPSAAAKVEYYIDGFLKWTENIAPYIYNGDPGGQLDPDSIPEGSHEFKVIATTSGGAVATNISVATTKHTVAPQPSSGGEGRVKFFEYAGNSMWNYVHGDGTITAWMKAHWQMLEAYHPSWDIYTDEIPSLDYIDCSAIYKNSSGQPDIPALTLKDKTGAYVQFYGNTEFLPDIGNPAWWDYVEMWTSQAKAAGFIGVKYDDVNLYPIPHSTPYKPINPRTGAEYTDADWARDFANGLARMRTKFPKPFIIIHNSVWWNQSLGQPDIARAAKQCDIYMHERGAISNGDIPNLLAYVDQLHAWGVDSLYLASNTTSNAQSETNLAVALLGSNGEDWAYNNDWEPDGWWAGNDYDLGAAKGPRYTSGTIIRRDFDKGYATYDTSTKVGKVIKTA